MNLHLEIREQAEDTKIPLAGGLLSLSPILDEDYWAYRVQVTPTQAVLGFPKHWTIGIGFQVEPYDHNRNMPYTLSAEYIADWIWPNKGPSIRRGPHYERVVNAIRLIQAQAMIDKLVPERRALREDIDRLKGRVLS